MKCEILRELTADDCISVEPNDNPRYPDADVYKFLKEVNITSYGEAVVVELYIKAYILDRRTHELVFVISFHEEGVYD